MSVKHTLLAASCLLMRSRYTPRFFEAEYADGRPKISEEGRRIVEEEVQRSLRVAGKSRESEGTPATAPASNA